MNSSDNFSALFDLPPHRNGKKVVELRALTHGLPPKAVKENMKLFYDEWHASGVDAWNLLQCSSSVFLVGDESSEEANKTFGWWTLPEVLGDRFISRLLNAPTGSCIMQPNATYTMFSLLSCKELNISNRRKIICTESEFPSVIHTIVSDGSRYENFSETSRNEIQFQRSIVPIESVVSGSDSFFASIDENTIAVALSHVGFTRGERLSDDLIRKIVKRAHSVGALVILDGYHAIGGRPIDVQALGIDIYFGGLLKEGCGSSGSCFLYIRKGLNLTPALSGWFADEHPFSFEQNPTTNTSVRRRFLLGTTSVASLYHSVEGLKIMLHIGLDKVGADVLQKVQTITSIFSNGGISVVSPQDPERMSALIVIEAQEANSLRQYLGTHMGIYVDARKNKYIRMAPHIYNTLEEVEYAANEIVKAVREGSYLSHSVTQIGGPVT